LLSKSAGTVPTTRLRINCAFTYAAGSGISNNRELEIIKAQKRIERLHMCIAIAEEAIRELDADASRPHSDSASD